MKFLFLLFFSFQAFAFPGLGEEQSNEDIHMTPSHIIILQTDAENIWGAYYYAVQNGFPHEKEFIAKIRLPRETVDFQAADGLSSENFSTLEDGSLRIQKIYKPGLTLQGIQFKVPVKKNSSNVLTFAPTQDIPSLFFATEQNILRLSAVGFEEGIPPMLSGGTYRGIQAQNVQAGQEIQVEIRGFPGGRGQFLVLGGCFGFLLLILACVFTLRSRKEKTLESFV